MTGYAQYIDRTIFTYFDPSKGGIFNLNVKDAVLNNKIIPTAVLLFPKD
jgi:hypothetical protein